MLLFWFLGGRNRGNLAAASSVGSRCESLETTEVIMWNGFCYEAELRILVEDALNAWISEGRIWRTPVHQVNHGRVINWAKVNRVFFFCVFQKD